MEKVLVKVADIMHNASSFTHILKHISGFKHTEGAKIHLVYCHGNFSFLLQPKSELEKTINLSKKKKQKESVTF